MLTRIQKSSRPLHFPGDNIGDVSWAVSLAGRILLGDGSCLPQALAAQTLLTRRGIQVALRIGVTKLADNSFLAHAWVENKSGDILVGGETTASIEKFQQFPDFERTIS